MGAVRGRLFPVQLVCGHAIVLSLVLRHIFPGFNQFLVNLLRGMMVKLPSEILCNIFGDMRFLEHHEIYGPNYPINLHCVTSRLVSRHDKFLVRENLNLYVVNSTLAL